MVFTSITFSGLPGAGKTTLLNEILKKTGWRAHHIGGVLREMHLKWQKENNSNKSFSEWYADKNLVSRKLIKNLNDEARELLRKGNVILDSRFGPLNSQGLKNCLNVFVTAPLEVRVKRRSESQKTSIQEVKNDLISRENSELERGKEFYADFVNDEGNYDYRELSHYNLVLNTDVLTIEQEVDKVLSMLDLPKKISLITMSGQPGSGNTTISKLLASQLNLDFFNVGTLWKDVAKGQASNKFYYPLFKEICEGRGIAIPNFSNSNDSHAAHVLWKTSLGNSREFNESIDELQLKLAEKGNILIEGKLSLFMIKSSELKIWIKADFGERARRTSLRDSLNLEEAKKILFERQEKEREGWKKIYGFDYFEQEQIAEIVVDSTNKTPQDAVSEIINKINNKL